jgi:hypothetical protein
MMHLDGNHLINVGNFDFIDIEEMAKFMCDYTGQDHSLIQLKELPSKMTLTKVASFNSSIATLLGQQKALEDEVDALTDMASCHRWRHTKLGIGASAQQMAAEPELGPPALKIQF